MLRKKRHILFFFLFLKALLLFPQLHKSLPQQLADSLKNTRLNDSQIKRISDAGLKLTKDKKNSGDPFLYYTFLYHRIQTEDDDSTAITTINAGIKDLLHSSLYQKDSLHIEFLLLRSDVEDFADALKTLAYIKQISDRKKISIDYYYYLYALYNYGNKLEHDSLETWINASIKYSKANKDSAHISYGYQTKAKLYKSKGDNYKAFLNYHIALEYIPSKDFERAVILNNISILLTEIEDFDSALPYARESITCTETSPLFHALAHTTLAELFLYKQDYDSIYYYSGRAIEIAKSVEGARDIVTKNTFYLGVYYYYKNNKARAKQYFDSVKQQATNSVLLFYNDIYTSKLEFDEGRFAKALSILKPYTHYNYTPAYTIQLNTNIANYYKLLSETEEKSGKTANALLYIKQYNAINDSINLLSVSNNINSAKINFELNKLKEEDFIKYSYEKKLIEQQKAFGTRTIIYILCILISIVIGSILAIVFYIRIKQNIAINRANEAKYNLLKIQLNPHFVSNAMSSIQGYILNKDKIIASNYLSDFSKLTRMIFEKSSHDFILLEDELTILKLFLELQQLRFPDTFNYELIYDSALTGSILIPPMLIQPLIENSIEHNAWDHNEGTIKVTFQILDKTYLSIQVSDNGKGLNGINPACSEGALGTIQKRIDTLNAGTHKSHITFTENKEGGLNVQLNIPYRTDE